MDGWKTTFLLGWPIFGGYASFRGCKGWDVIIFLLAASLQKMWAISMCTPKICRGSLLICHWVRTVSIPVPLTDLKSNHLSFLSFFIVSHDFCHLKCHILHGLFAGQNKNNQPITSDFPSFPRVNPTHGAALGGWTRAGSAPSVSASRASQEAGLFEGCSRCFMIPNCSYYPVSNFTTLLDSFQIWFFRFCIVTVYYI